MATQISFTDSAGTATLTNGKPGAAGRFANWIPSSRPVGDARHRLSDGARSMFVFRTDYGASFELRGIPVADTGGVRPLEIAVRLVDHLLRGGTCEVYTGDSATATYLTCGLAPGSSPGLTLSSPQHLEFTLSLALINLAASPVAMTCRYR